MTESGARKKAQAIRDMWKTNGYDVEVWAVKVETKDDSRGHNSGPTEWGIRSNLVNGLPPQKVMPRALRETRA